ncbi:DUF2309 domain-containing protein [Pseudohaliea rubra]|uniref:Probable inorganic carbon transporter subunit DabA n=1 Tax=Pseudohaliea rubra DSM 19751 TaxID=1265313 RepID=A0A095VNM6_9GAMM|nr:DUF2309 domain-containing protein [Pseudohaliea rubra]KGE02980.1 putative transmembrane protein coupled to NADH-ubiquinone oxidoreductase chain 5-like protein [Pseudohaliea rubra DSM 19751]
MTSATLKQHIEAAAAPVSQFWPMKGFVSHNPLQGLEHLPFDEAFREAANLFGAAGYLPLTEYRALHWTGRIDAASVQQALRRCGPADKGCISLLSRSLSAGQVQHLHLLHGIDALPPALFDWQVTQQKALERPRGGASVSAEIPALWQAALASLGLDDPRLGLPDAVPSRAQPSAEADLPFQRCLSDWLDETGDDGVVSAIDAQVIKWVSAFVDEGMAGWVMPSKQAGFFSAWRELSQYDSSGRLLGISAFKEKVRALPGDAETCIQRCMEALQVPEARWSDYLARTLAQLPGWTGLIRWRSENPDDPIQKHNPIDVSQYLAVRLFYEVQLVELAAQRRWGIAGTLPAISRRLARAESAGQGALLAAGANAGRVCRDGWRLFQLAQLLKLSADELGSLRQQDANTVLAWLDAFPPEDHQRVWLEAYEDSFRRRLLGKIAEHRAAEESRLERPLAQAAFCIDVRSEPFRRHFEATGPFETFGYAGFFGIPIDHRSFDSGESFPLCPVLLSPAKATLEVPRGGQDDALARYASGSRWQQLGEHLFHDLKHNPIAAFLLVDVLGLFFSVALIGKTLLRRPYAALARAARRLFRRPVATALEVDAGEAPAPYVTGLPIELSRGFSLEQQADFVEGGLRTIGLVENFGRFVVLCGHGSSTDNNPYAAALDCGACGGRHGDPNARAFAAMANKPAVRAELARRGLAVPDDTWFLPAKHDTTADTVAFYDLADLPGSHQQDLEILRRSFLQAGQKLALERCASLPGAPARMSPAQAHAHVGSRAVDWATTRPEWGLSGNAAFIIGRRAVTRGLDIGGRCFLHSYDASTDPEGAILEKIMTAPLVVGEWINMQYYTSATDPWKYGSGSKVIHNVVGGIGVMYGSQSDLATGLPLQTVNDGASHYHEPMRLLTIIEAEALVVAAIIARHAILQQFFHKGWLNLVVLDRHTGAFQRYNTDASWEAVAL